MNFLFREYIEHKSKLIIFIDLDGTLVQSMPFRQVGRFIKSVDEATTYSRMSDELKVKKWTDVGGRFFDWYGERYIAFSRPHAHRFLLECQKIGHTCIFTANTHAFQMRVTGVLNFPIKELYGEEDFAHVPQTDGAILVDDNPQIARNKLSAIGVGLDRFLQIGTWKDADWNDNQLIEFLPKIRYMVKQYHFAN